MPTYLSRQPHAATPRDSWINYATLQPPIGEIVGPPGFDPGLWAQNNRYPTRPYINNGQWGADQYIGMNHDGSANMQFTPLADFAKQSQQSPWSDADLARVRANNGLDKNGMPPWSATPGMFPTGDRRQFTPPEPTPFSQSPIQAAIPQPRMNLATGTPLSNAISRNGDFTARQRSPFNQAITGFRG